MDHKTALHVCSTHMAFVRQGKSENWAALHVAICGETFSHNQWIKAYKNCLNWENNVLRVQLQPVKENATARDKERYEGKPKPKELAP